MANNNPLGGPENTLNPRTTLNSSRFTRLAGSNTPLMTKIAIGKISETLVSSPKLREEFIADPEKFVSDQFGMTPDASELEFLTTLQEQFADGFCCGGCACASPLDAGELAINPRILNR